MRTTILGCAVLATSATASYVLEDNYSSDSFASMFDFFTDNDPTNGYVNYVDYNTAVSSGLYKADNGQVYIGVDSTNVATGRGRDSVRIATNKVYNHGLVILDLAHMPGGQCGTWPAFWMLGPNWPNQGEIDIIEQVNSASVNSLTLHTDAGCAITNTGAFSGVLETSNCDINAPSQAANAGCSIQDQQSIAYGTGFNANGGGVYATEWTSEAISIYFFPRNAIPADITNGNPDPSNWGLPKAQFTGACDLDEHVTDQQLVFDVTFCGDWAGQVWSEDTTCAPKASTCNAYVQDNPTAFTETYWLINSLKVYTQNGAAVSSAATPTASTTASSVPSSTSFQAGTITATTFLTATSSSAAIFTSSSSSSPAIISTPALLTSTAPTTLITVTPSTPPPTVQTITVIPSPSFSAPWSPSAAAGQPTYAPSSEGGSWGDRPPYGGNGGGSWGGRGGGGPPGQRGWGR